MAKQKLKVHSGASKRFEVTGTKKLKRRSAFSSHLLAKKAADRKRRYAKDINVSDGDKKTVRRMLGI